MKTKFQSIWGYDKLTVQFGKLFEKVRSLAQSAETNTQATLQALKKAFNSRQYKAVIKQLQSKYDNASISAEEGALLVGSYSKTNQGKLATSCGEKLCARFTDSMELHFQTGNALLRTESNRKGLGILQRAAEIQPNNAVVQANIGVAHNRLNEQGDAIHRLKQALAISPAYGFAHNNLGQLLCRIGNVKAGLRSMRRGMLCAEDPLRIMPRLLYWQNYLAETTQEKVYLDAKAWASQFEADTEFRNSGYWNTPNPERRLKIAFLSGDYCAHPVSFFLPSLFQGLDRKNFEVYAFSDGDKVDFATEELKSQVDHFITCNKMSDDQLIKSLELEKIDILVELSGHTGQNRLSVMKQRPTPLSVSWLGYPATTGLSTIDYRITDRQADPREHNALHSEKLLKLKNGFLCYQPLKTAPEVSPAPSQKKSFITFGSFNNLGKVSDHVIALWAEILHQVPRSKLVIKRQQMKDDFVKDYFVSRFQQHGIAKSRIRIIKGQPKIEQHLSKYAEMDIALDTFPYNGTTTTFEALHMGVPVITLAGKTHTSRVSSSILHFAGLDELITESDEQYVAKAVELANSKTAITEYRKKLRKQLVDSPVCDQQRFAKEFGGEMRAVWKNWCNSQ